MNNYTITLEFLGKKWKTKIKATSESKAIEIAKEAVKSKIKVIEIKDDIVEKLFGSFGMKIKN